MSPHNIRRRVRRLEPAWIDEYAAIEAEAWQAASTSLMAPAAGLAPGDTVTVVDGPHRGHYRITAVTPTALAVDPDTSNRHTRRKAAALERRRQATALPKRGLG
jgi:hypothetical protein